MVQALGRYELIRRLARGGMAEVYLARRRVAGVEKRVVIKRIRQERVRDPRFLAMFVREARLSMALVHQNVVPTFDFGREGEVLFLAMEHVDGRDLGAALARAGSRGLAPGPLLAAFIAAQCCQALAYAHGRRGLDGALLGVVHRDVAPRNVLLSWSGEVKLADFGVAALVGDDTDVVRGTPAYMAPEQARGESVDPRCDVFALGLVLGEMLAGRRSRTGTDVAEVLAAARAGVSAPPPEDAPPALAATIQRATAAVAADRHADARAMFVELDRFIVATRAADPSLPSPEVLLASWLAALWPDGDDAEAAVTSRPLGADAPLVTFLDDGEESVLGEGGATVRSLAATLAEAALDDGARSDRGATAGGGADADHAPGSDDPLRRRSASVTPASRSRRRTLALAVAASLGAAGLAAAWWSVPRRGDSRAIDAGTSVAAPPADEKAATDADARSAPTPLPAAPAPPAAPLSADGAAAAIDGGAPARAIGLRPAPRPGGRPTNRVATPAATRNVTFGARPWALVYVDDDPTARETPETVALTPGPHRVRFEQPMLHVSRTITIDVPVDRDIEHVEIMTEP